MSRLFKETEHKLMEVPIIARIDGKHVQIQANLNWTIYQLKQHLYLHCSKKPEDLKVIFAGSEINNSVVLKNCYLTHGTVVHVIVVENPSNHTQDGYNTVTPTTFIAPTAEGIKCQKSTDSKRSRFYVYCKSACELIRPGKLRVRCSLCKDGAFEIKKGPDSWTDVLTPALIPGVCNKNQCDGSRAEFYFKCDAPHELSTMDDHAIPLALLRTNTLDVPCLGCTDISDIVLVFPCGDTHVMCLDCFATYMQVKLNERAFVLSGNIGYTLPCPGMGGTCERTYIEDIHHFLIAGKQQYERYKNFGAEEFVLQNGGILCPGEGCGNGLMLEDDSKKIVCHRIRGGCGLIFCRDCRNAYHEGSCQQLVRLSQATQSLQGYQVDRTRAQQARWLEECDSANTIEHTSKRCPGCSSPTEKSGKHNDNFYNNGFIKVLSFYKQHWKSPYHMVLRLLSSSNCYRLLTYDESASPVMQ